MHQPDTDCTIKFFDLTTTENIKRDLLESLDTGYTWIATPTETPIIRIIIDSKNKHPLYIKSINTNSTLTNNIPIDMQFEMLNEFMQHNTIFAATTFNNETTVINPRYIIYAIEQKIVTTIAQHKDNATLKPIIIHYCVPKNIAAAETIINNLNTQP